MKAKIFHIDTDLLKIPAVDLFGDYIYPKLKFLKLVSSSDPTVHYYLSYNNKFGSDPFYIRVRGTKKLVIEVSNADNYNHTTKIRKISRSKLAAYIQLNELSIFKMIFDSINLMDNCQYFTEPFPEIYGAFSLLSLSLIKKNIIEDFNLGSLEFDIFRQYENFDSHLYLTVGLFQGFIHGAVDKESGEIKFNIHNIRIDSNPYNRYYNTHDDEFLCKEMKKFIELLRYVELTFNQLPEKVKKNLRNIN
jgi:hypothetical protein